MVSARAAAASVVESARGAHRGDATGLASLAFLALVQATSIGSVAAQAETEAAGAEPGAEAPTEDATPDETALAQAHFRRGVTLVEEQRLPEAVDAFRASAALVPRASTSYNLALSLFRLGRYRECLDAVGQLESQLGVPGASDAGMRDRAAVLRERASEQLARLVLLIEPVDARLSVDGEPVLVDGAMRALLLDPGLHRVRLEREGFVPATRELQLRAGRAVREAVALRREPMPARRARAHRGAESRDPPPEAVPVQPLAVASAAVSRAPPHLIPALMLGGAGLLVAAGVVTGVVTAEKDDSVRALCGGSFDNCPPSAMDDADEVERLALVTDVLLFGGAALAVAGGVLWFALDGQGDAVQAGLAPGGATFRARF